MDGFTGPCGCGSFQLGKCPGPLSLCLQPGMAFSEVIELVDAQGIPMDWPAGTQGRLEFTWGTGTSLEVLGVVEGSLLHFTMTPEETERVPRRSKASIDLDTGTGWYTWREGVVNQ